MSVMARTNEGETGTMGRRTLTEVIAEKADSGIARCVQQTSLLSPEGFRPLTLDAGEAIWAAAADKLVAGNGIRAATGICEGRRWHLTESWREWILQVEPACGACHGTGYVSDGGDCVTGCDEPDCLAWRATGDSRQVA